MGCAWLCLCLMLGVFQGEGMPVPSYQRQRGRGGSMLSPASLRASSHLGTDTEPQLQLGWGMQNAASSERSPLGLKQRGDHCCPQSREGPSSHPAADAGGCPWHLCSSGSGDPALPGAGSRGTVAAGCSRWPELALCPATPGTAACNSLGSDCPVCKSTVRAHLGERPENGSAQPGLSLCAEGSRGVAVPGH